MNSCYLSQLAPALDAELVGKDLTVSRIFIDSRRACHGGLFVALRGPHFDAHDYLGEAIKQGAVAAVVERQALSKINESRLKENQLADIPKLIVSDSRKALGDLARFNRQHLDTRIVAITGSSGKTTVKEMTATILQGQGKTHATRGNFNNEIGAPLTLLEMKSEHEYAVVELGANHAGEIAYTAGITRPEVALVNNVSAAHLEGFGDLQGVARAKGEIFSEIKSGGVAVINLDDDFAEFWMKSIRHATLTYSRSKAADVTASEVSLDENQCARFELKYDGAQVSVRLSLAGLHNVSNALAAASCCLALGVPLQNIATGLAQAPVVSGRLMTEMLASGCRVIDDTYNANLDSMRAAISLLARYPGRKILVIGDMAELGESGRQCHEEVGQIASDAGIDLLLSCGVLTRFSQAAFNGSGEHFSDQTLLIQKLKKQAKADTTILVKGSRSAHMENVVLALTEGSHEQRLALKNGGD